MSLLRSFCSSSWAPFRLWRKGDPVSTDTLEHFEHLRNVIAFMLELYADRIARRDPQLQEWRVDAAEFTKHLGMTVTEFYRHDVYGFHVAKTTAAPSSKNSAALEE